MEQRDDKNHLQINNRRYLGSKQKMLNFIDEVVKKHTKNVEVVADVFGGTGVVADLFRGQGKTVIVNDILYSNYISFLTWFDNESADMDKISRYIEELNHIEPIQGYVTENFGDSYFSKENAMKIDAIRERIDSYIDLNDRERAMLLTSLLYAMDKVANTVGHYDAFRRIMDSTKELVLKVPVYNSNISNLIYNKDANLLVREIEADLVYIDTPYNSRGYENAYHVLENIAEWKKPEVEGVAKKAVNRSEKSSAYTRKAAPEAFDDLIQGITAKYILVSYNNMNKKGNARSNAKISNEEILSSLRKKGKVEVYETDFSPFTTGKSKIDNHKELLYLCKVNLKRQSKKDQYIKSALNYTGGKYKLLPQIMPYFPKDFNNCVDLFAGGATVAINIAANDPTSRTYYVNDNNSHVIELYKYFRDNSIKDLQKKIEKAIDYYKLSDSSKYGYEYYGADGAKGLGNYNKEGYLKLRRDYNNQDYTRFDKEVLFYLLIVYGFNNQIRFNGKGEFNLPVGKRDFNKSMREKLCKFHHELISHDIQLSSIDFREFIIIGEKDFVYADPPYLISTATYNENNGWTIEDDRALFDYLDKLNERGAYFALSNVLLHKGAKNEVLETWAQKYNLIKLNYHYNNSNYQSKAKQSETIEVLVTNY